MEESKDLIVVEQLPQIKARLEELSKEIDRKTEIACSLVITEDNYKDIKKIRAALNKDFQETEEQRKFVKEQILAPYKDFENEYKTLISDKFQNADKTLKERIYECENTIKNRKEVNIIEYFEELRTSLNLDKYVEFSDLGINIKLSDTENSLRKQVKEKLEIISSDLNVIQFEEYKDEILIEYLKDFDFARAKLKVMNDIQQKLKIQELQKQRQEALEKQQKIVETVDNCVDNSTEIEIPEELIEKEELLTTTFRVTGTKKQLIALREYMNENNIKIIN